MSYLHKLYLKYFSTYPFSQRLTIFIIWWAFLTLIQTYIIHQFGFTTELALMDASISITVLSLLGMAIIIMYTYYQPSKANSIYRLFFAIIITALHIYVTKWLLNYFTIDNILYTQFLEQSITIRSVFAFLVLGFLTIINWLWSNLSTQQEAEKRRTDTEQLAINAELERLRQQLQPHFLFNSLNSISALAGSNPEAARKMIQQLSDFLRGTIKKDGQQLVVFKEELEQLHLYLEIEKVRFGHRLTINIDSDEKHQQANIPPLLLQPLVENAIKFGLYGTIGNISIDLSTQLDPYYLKIIIKNPYDEDTINSQNGTGFGLNAISRRLFLLYARNDLMQIEKKNKVFTVQLSIPQNQMIQNLLIKNK
jgi:two-component system, LytTR family, sensor kinase